MKTRKHGLESLERRELFAGLGEIVGPVEVPHPSDDQGYVETYDDVDNSAHSLHDGPQSGLEAGEQMLDAEELSCRASILTNLGFNLDPATGTLDISGTQYSDDVQIYRLGDDIRIEFSTGSQPTNFRSFAVDEVTHITFEGDRCGDRFRNTTDIPVQVHGGGGDDSVVGGQAADVIDGGAGNDTIHGGGGNDELRGDDGNDLLWGDQGSDSLFGGGGFDVLYGGRGGDTLDGGEQDDELYGEQGNDLLYGGAGVDLLHGGNGDDRLLGGLGEQDTLTSGDGADRYLVPVLPNGSGIRLEEVVTDFQSEDATLYIGDVVSTQTLTFFGQDVEFYPGEWQDEEILVVDKALGNLFERVGSNALLENSDGSSITMYRAGVGIYERVAALRSSGFPDPLLGSYFTSLKQENYRNALPWNRPTCPSDHHLSTR